MTTEIQFAFMRDNIVIDLSAEVLFRNDDSNWNARIVLLKELEKEIKTLGGKLHNIVDKSGMTNLSIPTQIIKNK